MRRSYTNEMVLIIVVALTAAAIVFAWRQSRPAVPHALPPPATSPAPTTAVAPAVFQWQALGAATYEARCLSCHDQGQATRRLPPLRGHAVDLFQADGGREYLANFILYGLQGEIQVGGETYRGRHPVYADRLSDKQIAAVLNHMLTSWGNADHLGRSPNLYSPDDIAPLRQYPLSPSEARDLRPALSATPDPSLPR